MCDNDSMDDMIAYQLKSPQLSRRRFGAVTLGVGVASLLSGPAGAAWIEEAEVDASFIAPFMSRLSGLLP